MAVEALSPNHRPPGRSWLCRYFEKQKENHFISISLWDRLGPGTLDCSAAMLALGHTPPQATKKLHETKIAACICICCRFWTKDTKRPKNPTATSEEPEQKQGSGAKEGYCACPLHTPPPTGWAQHLSHACGPSPHPDPREEGAHPTSGTREPVLTSHAAGTSSQKALPEFFTWPLTNCYWLRRPRTLVGYIVSLDLAYSDKQDTTILSTLGLQTAQL